MNRKCLILTESEKNRILGMHKIRFEIQKNFIFEQAIDGQVVQGPQGDPYQYKVEAGKAYYAKKSEGANPKWIEQKNPVGIKAIQDKIINPATPSTPTGTTTNTGNTTTDSTTTGNTSQSLGQNLTSRKDLRQDARQQRRDARQQRRDARQDARQQRRVTKEQEQQCNTWFKNLIKFKATMKPEQLKQYQDTLNAKPCCEVIPVDKMKAAGLTSCATQPQTPMATPAPTPMSGGTS